MRSKTTKIFGLFSALCLAPAYGACGGGDDGESSATAPPQATRTIDLVVDANRDGVIDPASADDQKGDAFTDTHGASFLANLDDDDGDHIRDIDDEIINGVEDEKDLARVVVGAFAGAPEGAKGVLTIDAPSAPNVRIWKRLPSGLWQLILGSVGSCATPGAPCGQLTSAELSADEVHGGQELAIEGRSFRTDDAAGAWSGLVTVRYEVHDSADKPVKTSDAPEGADTVVLRVAPWILFGNLSPFDTAWASDDSPEFVEGLSAPLAERGLEFRKITNWTDQWTQDYFQTAWTSIPAPNGAVQGMRIANPRPWGRDEGVNSSLPINWIKKTFLAPDRGMTVIYKEAWTGSTYDSHGNHDLLPPYENGADVFPMGRIIHGSGVLPEYPAFYRAQGIQGPPLVVKTSWLSVGHVDEVFSYVPAKTPRGWKLLVGSPRMARTMLEDEQAAGHGGVAMFVGKKRWVGNSYVNAEITIDAALADQDLMTWSQEAQAEIDGMLATLTKAVGLEASEVIEVPYLFEEDIDGKVAWNPGTANVLVFGDTIIHADPFGPVIGGVDMFKKDLLARIGTSVNALGSKGEGLDVRFADDWYDYHINAGEVHCGSNVDAKPPASAWWETGR